MHRRKRALYKRRTGRKTFKHNKQQMQVKKMSRRIQRHNIKTPIANIGRSLQPTHIIRQFTDIQTFKMDVLTYRTTGIFAHDYKVSDLLSSNNQTYYSSNYHFCNLLAFHVTFWISGTQGLIEYQNAAVPMTNYVYAGAIDPRRKPELYILHANNGPQQSEFALKDISSEISSWLTNKNVKRLSQSAKAYYQWHMPTGYQSTYITTAALDPLTQTIEQAFAGPLYDEPHGFVARWNDVQNYPQLATAYIKLSMRITSIFAFKDRKAEQAE